jgi:hypothetical protein
VVFSEGAERFDRPPRVDEGSNMRGDFERGVMGW